MKCKLKQNKFQEIIGQLHSEKQMNIPKRSRKLIQQIFEYSRSGAKTNV